MTENIVDFNGITTLDLDPDRVLKAALGKLSSVLVLGEMEDGSEYFASSMSDGPNNLWLLERAKLKLLRIVDEG